jgi:hypothetical protein
MAILGYPNYLEMASPNRFRGEKIARWPDCGVMSRSNPDELDNTAIARRMRILRYYATGGGQGSQARFAVQLGIEPRRWNNFERGYPLPRDMAVRLVRTIPGLTTDWIWLNREDGLPARLQRELADAGKALTVAEDGSSASSRDHRTKSRA